MPPCLPCNVCFALVPLVDCLLCLIVIAAIDDLDHVLHTGFQHGWIRPTRRFAAIPIEEPGLWQRIRAIARCIMHHCSNQGMDCIQRVIYLAQRWKQSCAKGNHRRRMSDELYAKSLWYTSQMSSTFIRTTSNAMEAAHPEGPTSPPCPGRRAEVAVLMGHVLDPA